MTPPPPEPADDQPGLTDLPPDVRDAAAQAGLGGHRAGFGPATAESITWLVVFALGFGAFTVLMLIAGSLFALLPGAVTVLMIVVTAQRVRTNSESRNASLDIFQRGLTVAGARTLQAVRFDQTSVLQEIVHHSTNGRHTHTTHKYTLDDTDRAPVTLHATTGRITEGFPEPDQWGPAIQQAVSDAQFPAAWASIMAGDRLEFGKFWLTKSQIGAGKKAWPWSQVNEVRVHDGLLQLKSDGAWRSLTDSEVSRIPNCFVFIALAQRLAATR